MAISVSIRESDLANIPFCIERSGIRVKFFIQIQALCDDICTPHLSRLTCKIVFSPSTLGI